MQTIFAVENRKNKITDGLRTFLKCFLENKNNFYFSWNVTQSRYKYYFCAEFLEGGERKKHFPVLFSGKIAQLMNLWGYWYFLSKKGDRVSSHPRSGKPKLLHTGTCTSTSTRHVTLKSHLLLQFPYFFSQFVSGLYSTNPAIWLVPRAGSILPIRLAHSGRFFSQPFVSF